MAFLNPESMFYGKSAALFNNDENYNTLNDLKKTKGSKDSPTEESSPSTHQRKLCSKLKTLLKKHQDSTDDFIGARIKPLVLMTSFTTFVTSIFNTKDEEKIPRRLSFNKKVADVLAQDPNLKFILHLENNLLTKFHDHDPNTSDKENEKKRKLCEDEVMCMTDGTIDTESNNLRNVSKGTFLNQDETITNTVGELTTVETAEETFETITEIDSVKFALQQQEVVSIDLLDDIKSEKNDIKSETTKVVNEKSNEITSQSPVESQKQFNHCERSMFMRVSPSSQSTEDTLLVSKTAEDLHNRTAPIENENEEELSSTTEGDEDIKRTDTKSEGGWYTPPSDIVDDDDDDDDNVGNSDNEDVTIHKQHQKYVQNEGPPTYNLINSHRPMTIEEIQIRSSESDNNKASPEGNGNDKKHDKNNETLLNLSIQQQISANKSQPENDPNVPMFEDLLKSSPQSHIVSVKEQQQQQQTQPQKVDESNKTSTTIPKDSVSQKSPVNEPTNTTQTTTELNTKLVARSEQFVDQRSESPFEAISIAFNETKRTNTIKVTEWKVHHIMEERRSTSPALLSSQTSSPFEPIQVSELPKNKRNDTSSPSSSTSSFENITLP